MLPFHYSLMLKNIVLDCLADAIILGLCLHNHISYLHSWVLTEARQVKHHTRGDKTMEPHLELRPGLYSAPRHYRKLCWPFLHLATAFAFPSASSLHTLLGCLISCHSSLPLPWFLHIISFYLHLWCITTFKPFLLFPLALFSHLWGTMKIRDCKMQIHAK